MCGIFGFVSNGNYSSEKGEKLLVNGLSTISHRGPDACGILTSKKVFLGNTRLSIVDIDSGDQPFVSWNGNTALVFNGEIYNHVELRQKLEREFGIIFNTNCDTEVLVNLIEIYKEKAFDYLEGNFALAAWQKEEEIVMLARDRFGQRPLYYSKLGKNASLVFGSEIKTLSSDFVKLEYDAEEFSQSLIHWTGNGASCSTIFRGVLQVPIGHYVKFNIETKEADLVRYYKPFQGISFEGTVSDAAKEFRNLFLKSLERRSNAEVPSALYLSGGLDSSVVAGGLRILGREIPSFSLNFRQKAFDESPFQKSVVDYLGTNHVSVEFHDVDYLNLWRESLRLAELPVFRTAFIPMFELNRRVSSLGYKIALTGEGSDETLLGYDVYKDTILRYHWNELSEDERKSRFLNMYPWLREQNQVNSDMLFGWYKNTRNVLPQFLGHASRFSNGLSASKIVRSSGAPELKDLWSDYLDPVQKTQKIEYDTLLSSYLLSTQGDRMSLGNSIENRSPFMDYNLIDFANSLPVEYRLNYGNEKFILKEAFKDVLPNEVLNRSKQPYRSPDWMVLKMLLNQISISEDIRQHFGFIDWTVFNLWANEILSSKREPQEYKIRALLYVLSAVEILNILNESKNYTYSWPRFKRIRS